MKLHSHRQLLLFIALIAAGLTLLLIYFIPLPLHRYRIKIQEVKEPFIPNPNIVYHDFDHDGNSEMFALKYQQDINQSAAKIYSADGGLIEQWTFGERWLNRSYAFGDGDHDGRDEAYIFTQKRDSIFLYAFKPDKKGFLIDRYFIDKISNRNPQGQWDVQAMPGAFIDSDEDGSADFIFGLMAGYSLQPRRYYVFSLSKRQIIYKSPKGYAYFSGPQIIDIDKDGKPEILNKGGYAPGNANDNGTGTDDVHAYLFVLNKRLNYKFPPFIFGGRSSQIQILPAPDYMPGAILVVHNYQGARDIHSSLVLLSANGKIRISRTLSRNHTWSLFKMQRPFGEKVLLYDQQGYFEYLNAQLQTEKKLIVKGVEGTMEVAFDLDGDFNKEWIFRSKSRITIVHSDFSQALSFDIGNKKDCLILSLKKQNKRQPLLSLQNGDKRYLIAYTKNPFYPARFALYFILFALSFALLYMLFHAANVFFSYSAVFNYIIRNPRRGILLLNEKGRIVKINQTLIKQMHIDLFQIEGKKFQEIFSHIPTVRNFIDHALRSPGKYNEEVLISENTVAFRGRLFIRPLSGLLAYPVGFYFETNDYALAVQNDRLKVWSKTVQKMAHDIKTPLSSISINLAMVKQKLADFSPQALQQVEDDIELMLGEMARLREMTKNFLKFTNLEKPNAQIFSISVFLHEVVNDFYNYYSESLDFILDIDYEQDKICADRVQLKMVLQALIENAIDAVRGKGIIGLSASKIQKIDLGFEDFIEIEVFDNGPGIPSDVKDKIFEPYFTTKPDGTGMGLAIAKKIIEDHNGTIEIAATEKFPTIFRLMFPIGNIES